MEFEQLYREYFRDVYLYLRSLGAEPELAEEATQETFFKAMQSMDQFDGSRDIRAWLFVIGRNTLYRSYQRGKRFTSLPEGDSDSAVQVDVQPDIAEQLADRELAQEVHKLLHEMKEPYKEVFTLRVFGELPFEQIGNLFGRSAGWARVTYHRARKMLAEGINRRCES